MHHGHGPTIVDALEYWHYGGFYRRRNTVAGWWSIYTNKYEALNPKFEYNWNKNIDWFGLFKQLIVLSKAYYGYVHVFTDRENDGHATGSAICCFLRGTPSWALEKNGIPNLAWANYFGEEYVQELDKSLLQQHPNLPIAIDLTSESGHSEIVFSSQCSDSISLCRSEHRSGL